MQTFVHCRNKEALSTSALFLSCIPQKRTHSSNISVHAFPFINSPHGMKPLSSRTPKLHQRSEITVDKIKHVVLSVLKLEAENIHWPLRMRSRGHLKVDHRPWEVLFSSLPTLPRYQHSHFPPPPLSTASIIHRCDTLLTGIFFKRVPYFRVQRSIQEYDLLPGKHC